VIRVVADACTIELRNIVVNTFRADQLHSPLCCSVMQTMALVWPKGERMMKALFSRWENRRGNSIMQTNKTEI
jgi:hypothetical protein